MSRPIILDYSTERTESQQPNFQYSYKEDMNIMQFDSKQHLFIEADEKTLELLTKTFVERESDDSQRGMSELMTKTAVARERDDESFNSIELVTLTEISREDDDD